MQRDHASDGPIAHDMPDHPVRKPPPPAAEGYLGDTAEREPMANVVLGRPPVRASVIKIGVRTTFAAERRTAFIDVIQELRKRVGAEDIEALGEALFNASHTAMIRGDS